MKDGIVPEEFKASFRLSIEMYLNEDFMDSLGDDYSSFQTKKSGISDSDIWVVENSNPDDISKEESVTDLVINEK